MPNLIPAAVKDTYREARRRVDNAKTAYNSGLFSRPTNVGLYILATGKRVPATGLDVKVGAFGASLSVRVSDVDITALSQALWGENPLDMPFFGVGNISESELYRLNDGVVRDRANDPTTFSTPFIPQWSPAVRSLEEILDDVRTNHPWVAKRYERVYPHLKTRFQITALDVPDFIAENPALETEKPSVGILRVIGAYKDTEKVYRRCLENEEFKAGEFVRFNELYGDKETLDAIRQHAQLEALVVGDRANEERLAKILALGPEMTA